MIPQSIQQATSVSVPVHTHRFAEAGVDEADRAVAVETPVNLIYGGIAYAVMMATPADLEDFAIGFSLTEGIIADAADIRAVMAEQGEDGVRLRVDLRPGPLRGLLARRRSMSGRTSCGVCGIDDLAALPRAARRNRAAPAISAEAVRRALRGVPGMQPLNAMTRAAHAAAWAGPDGGLLCAREDVGRHNALDKLIGALLVRGTDPGAGFVVVTSRCSYEMIEKAAAFGAGALVAMSAPTSLGIARAAHHGMTLIGARGDTATVFAGSALRVCEM